MENFAYKDPPRFEMLAQKLVCMSPRPSINHSKVSDNIYWVFNSFLRGKSCTAFSDGVEVHLDQNNTFIPDVVVVCNRDIIKKNGIYGSPDLIVEVLSPSTAKNDKGYKKDLYEKKGVREYWIVEVETRSVEVYLLRDNKYVIDNIYSIFPDYLLEKMTAEEKAEIVMEFKTSLFPDLIISLEDIFEGML